MRQWTEGSLQEVSLWIIFASTFRKFVKQHFMNFTVENFHELSFESCCPLIRPTCWYAGEVFSCCWKSYEEAWGLKNCLNWNIVCIVPLQFHTLFQIPAPERILAEWRDAFQLHSSGYSLVDGLVEKSNELYQQTAVLSAETARCFHDSSSCVVSLGEVWKCKLPLNRISATWASNFSINSLLV